MHISLLTIQYIDSLYCVNQTNQGTIMLTHSFVWFQVLGDHKANFANGALSANIIKPSTILWFIPGHSNK